MKRLLRNLLRSSWVQRALGLLAAEYLRLVWLTNRFSFEPADVYELVEPQMPAIFAFWHGQHFMTPFIKTKESHRAKVLISRHRDGEFNAIAAERLGIGTIRGSGDHGGAFHRKGGVGAFREMVRALEDNYNVATDRRRAEALAGRGARHHHAGAGIRTADHAVRDGDQPLHPARKLGLAPPSICRSGAARWSASRHVYVPPDADAETMEKLRLQLEAILNEATRRAYAAVGRPRGRSWLIRCR